MIEDETNTATPKIMEPAGWDRTFAHVWEIAFGPELEKRLADGRADANYQVLAAQWLLPTEGENKILFNEEVRGFARIKTIRDVEKGDTVFLSDLDHIEGFELPDDLLDCGHFTIIRSGKGWSMVFNFLSGRAKARDMLVLAGQFLEAAVASRSRGHSGPAVDNLFSASELVSKAELILHRSKALQSKTHGAVASAINAWARLGNIDAAFVALFNKLGQQRPNARYGDATHRPPSPDLEDFDLIRAMIDQGLERVKPSIGDDIDPQET